MGDDYLIINLPDGRQDIFIYTDIFYDVLSGKVILNVNNVVGLQFWRRNKKYSIGYISYIIAITKDCPLVKQTSNSIDFTEIFSGSKSNWKQIVKLTLNGLYPQYFSISKGKTLESLITLSTLDRHYEKGNTIREYFSDKFNDLNGVNIYNGYVENEYVEYYEIKK